jgi:hypothetical protein
MHPGRESAAAVVTVRSKENENQLPLSSHDTPMAAARVASSPRTLLSMPLRSMVIQYRISSPKVMPCAQKSALSKAKAGRAGPVGVRVGEKESASLREEFSTRLMWSPGRTASLRYRKL